MEERITSKFPIKSFSIKISFKKNSPDWHRRMEYSIKKVSLVTFITYVYSGDDHVLTPQKAFVALTLFDIIRMPLAMLPLLIVYMVEVECCLLPIATLK